MKKKIYTKNESQRRKSASSANEDIVKKYIELFDRLPIGIYRTTPDGKILTANPAFLNLLGYSEMDDLEGIDLNKTHKNPDGRKQFREEIEEKGEVYAKESILVNREGKSIVVEEYAKVYKDGREQVLFYEGIVIDATLKKQNEERIIYLNRLKELILNLSTSFISIRLSDIDDQIVYSLKSIGKFIGADRSYVFLFDDHEMTTMSNTHEAIAEGVDSVIDELQELSTSRFSWWMDNLKKNKSIIISDVDNLPKAAANEKKLFKHQSVKSLFAVPMFFNYQLIGFLGFDMVNSYKVIDEEILELLNITASLFANILNYQKTEDEIFHYRHQLEAKVEQRTIELENLNRQLKMIAESSHDVVWTMDLNMRTTYMSPSVLKQLGYTPEEYMTLPLEKRLPPASVKKAKEVFKRILDSLANANNQPDQITEVFEMLHKTKDGKEIWGEVSFSLIINSEGKPIGIHGITRNIHERKLAETALWESNERFKALVENTSDWIWEVNPDGIYTYSSPMSLGILGYQPSEILGKSFADFLEPGTRDSSIRFFRNAVKSKQAFKGHENIALHKNGRHVHLETSGIPIFDIKGDFAGYRGIDRDVTEKNSIESALRNSQQKLTQHLRNTPMAYIEWDSNFEVIEWNPAAKKLFGYNKSQAMMDNMIEKLIPSGHREKVVEVFSSVLKTGKAVRKISQCTNREGKTVKCEWFITPLMDNTDNIPGMASLVREVD